MFSDRCFTFAFWRCDADDAFERRIVLRGSYASPELRGILSPVSATLQAQDEDWSLISDMRAEDAMPRASAIMARKAAGGRCA